LAVTIGERGVPAGLTSTAFQGPAGLGAPATPTAALQAAPAPLRVDLTLSPGARAFPEAAQDARCAAPVPTADGGQVISCRLDQPATGSTTTFAFDLQVDGPGQTADMVLLRGAVEEARFTAPIDLTQFESGLSVRYGTEPWTVGVRGSGTLSVSAAQAAAWDVPGAVLSIEVTGGVNLDPRNPTPGCTQVAAGNTTITCALPTIPAAGSVDFDVQLVVSGNGQQVRSLALVVGGREATKLDQDLDLRRGDGGENGYSAGPA
jgi:hypothetical protein